VVAVGRAEPGERRPALQPLLGEQAQAAVAQGTKPSPPPQSGEEPRQADRLAGESTSLWSSNQPPRRRRAPRSCPATDKASLRLDPPALVEQRAHRLRDAFGRDPQGGLAGGFVRAGAEPQRREGPLLRRSIAEEEAALGLLVHPTPRAPALTSCPPLRGSRPGRAANRHPFAEAGGGRRRRGCGARVTSVQESDGGRSSRGGPARRRGPPGDPPAPPRAPARAPADPAGRARPRRRSGTTSQAPSASSRTASQSSQGGPSSQVSGGSSIVPGAGPYLLTLAHCPGSWAVSAYADPFVSGAAGAACRLARRASTTIGTSEMTMIATMT